MGELQNIESGNARADAGVTIYGAAMEPAGKNATTTFEGEAADVVSHKIADVHVDGGKPNGRPHPNHDTSREA